VRGLVYQWQTLKLPLPIPSMPVFWGFVGTGWTLVATVLLIEAVRSVPAERWRALGLLACLGSFICLAMGIGWARAGALSASHNTPRYFSLALGFPYAVAFALELYGKQRFLRFSRPTLLVLAVVLAAASVRDAVAYGEARRDAVASLLRDVRGGMPVSTVVDRYAALIGFGYIAGADQLVSEMKALREAGHPSFRNLKDDSPIPPRPH
jgi:hypothetical protein